VAFAHHLETPAVHALDHRDLAGAGQEAELVEVDGRIGGRRGRDEGRQRDEQQDEPEGGLDTTGVAGHGVSLWMETLPMLAASGTACKAEPDEGRERARRGEGTGPVGPTARRRPNQTCACFQRFPAKQLLRRPSLEPTRPHAAYIPPCQQDKQWVRTGPDGQYC